MVYVVVYSVLGLTDTGFLTNNLFMNTTIKVQIFVASCVHFDNNILRIVKLCRCTFIIAFLLLLTGAALNDQRGEENMYFGSFCYVVKPGVFSGGAVLSLASVALAIVYYVALTSSKSPPTLTPQNQGIAMGQPVIPQQSSEPVFVHEDTYNRQQFP